MLVRKLEKTLNRLQNAIIQLHNYKDLDKIQLDFLAIKDFLSTLQQLASLDTNKYFRTNANKFFNIK